MSAQPDLRTGSAADRQAYYAAIRPLHLSPLWEQLHALARSARNTACTRAGAASS